MWLNVMELTKNSRNKQMKYVPVVFCLLSLIGCQSGSEEPKQDIEKPVVVEPPKEEPIKLSMTPVDIASLNFMAASVDGSQSTSVAQMSTGGSPKVKQNGILLKSLTNSNNKQVVAIDENGNVHPLIEGVSVGSVLLGKDKDTLLFTLSKNDLFYTNPQTGNVELKKPDFDVLKYMEQEECAIFKASLKDKIFECFSNNLQPDGTSDVVVYELRGSQMFDGSWVLSATDFGMENGVFITNHARNRLVRVTNEEVIDLTEIGIHFHKVFVGNDIVAYKDADGELVVIATPLSSPAHINVSHLDPSGVLGLYPNEVKLLGNSALITPSHIIFMSSDKAKVNSLDVDGLRSSSDTRLWTVDGDVRVDAKTGYAWDGIRQVFPYNYGYNQTITDDYAKKLRATAFNRSGFYDYSNLYHVYDGILVNVITETSQELGKRDVLQFTDTNTLEVTKYYGNSESGVWTDIYTFSELNFNGDMVELTVKDMNTLSVETVYYSMTKKEQVSEPSILTEELVKLSAVESGVLGVSYPVVSIHEETGYSMPELGPKQLFIKGDVDKVNLVELQEKLIVETDYLFALGNKANVSPIKVGDTIVIPLSITESALLTETEGWAQLHKDPSFELPPRYARVREVKLTLNEQLTNSVGETMQLTGHDQLISLIASGTFADLSACYSSSEEEACVVSVLLIRDPSLPLPIIEYNQLKKLEYYKYYLEKTGHKDYTRTVESAIKDN